jgi:site-specific recombinase XerD
LFSGRGFFAGRLNPAKAFVGARAAYIIHCLFYIPHWKEVRAQAALGPSLKAADILRHSCATQLLESGTNIRIVGGATGAGQD